MRRRGEAPGGPTADGRFSSSQRLQLGSYVHVVSWTKTKHLKPMHLGQYVVLLSELNNLLRFVSFAASSVKKTFFGIFVPPLRFSYPPTGSAFRGFQMKITPPTVYNPPLRFMFFMNFVNF